MSSRERDKSLQEIVGIINRATPAGSMPTKVIAVDGYGGAGKSVLAAQLALILEAPVVHTDDFASWDSQFEWRARLLSEVLEPIARGEEARYRRYDWDARELAEWLTLPVRPPHLIVEGVSSSRREFDPFLALRIWVEASADTRLRRGLERDGDEMIDQWKTWMHAEEEHFAADDPLPRADIIVSGEDPASHSPRTLKRQGSDD
jgi:uridine kinase